MSDRKAENRIPGDDAVVSPESIGYVPMGKMVKNWPDVNTSTSENIANLHLSRSAEFNRVLEAYHAKQHHVKQQ